MATVTDPSLADVLTDNFLTCKICLEVYSKPKILPCLHTFCLNCIQTLMQNATSREQIACPACREPVQIADGGAEELKTNFYINSLIELVQVKSPDNGNCAFCVLTGQKKTPTAKCLDCGDALCQECAERHTLTRLTLTHKVITMEDLQSGSYDNEIRAMQEIPCSLHEGEIVKYFCDSCNTPVCRDCILLEHKSHACLKPAEALKSRLPALGGLVEELDRKYQYVAQSQKTVDAQSQSYAEEEGKLIAEIQSAADSITRTVQREKDDAIEKVKTIFRCQRKDIELKKEEVDCVVGVIQSSLDFCKSIMKDGKELEILSLEGMLRDRLDHLRLADEQLQPNATEETDFSPVLSIKRIENDSGEIGLFSVFTQSFITPTFVKPMSVRGPDDRKDPVIQDMARYDETSIIVADMANQNLKIISNEGNFLGQIDLENFSPKYVTAHSGGIATSSNASLLLLSREGKVIRKISLLESARDSHPLSSMWVSQSNEYTLACNIDRLPNPSITILDNEGNKVQQMKTSPHILPIYVTVNSQGYTIVSDWIGNCIRIIDGNGRFAHSYCPDPTKDAPVREGSGRQNWRPGSVAVDKSDRIYIADYDKRKVTVLSATGKYLYELKTQMQNIDRPRALTIGDENLLFVAGKTEFVNVYKLAET